LEVYGLDTIAHFIHGAADHVADLVPAAANVAPWLVTALGSALVGSVIGAGLVLVAAYAVAPILRFVGRLREQRV